MATASGRFEIREDVLSATDAIALVGRSHVRWMTQTGQWQRPYRGVLVTHSGPITRDQRERAVLLAHGRHAVLAGLSAANRDGFEGFATSSIILLVPTGRTPPRLAGVVVHRSRLLGHEDIHPTRTPRRTRIARSIVDAASWATRDQQARAIVAASVQQRLVRAEDLVQVGARRLNLPRRMLIQEAAVDAGGGSHSGYELAFLDMCKRYALPMPSRQRLRVGADGRTRYTDAEFDEYNLVVEIDGSQHMDVSSWWTDMNSQNELHLEGKTVLRYPGFIVRHQPWVAARQIQTFIDECDKRWSA